MDFSESRLRALVFKPAVGVQGMKLSIFAAKENLSLHSREAYEAAVHDEDRGVPLGHIVHQHSTSGSPISEQHLPRGAKAKTYPTTGLRPGKAVPF